MTIATETGTRAAVNAASGIRGVVRAVWTLAFAPMRARGTRAPTETGAVQDRVEIDGNPYLAALLAETAPILTSAALGRRAASLRETLGLTVQQAAARAGLSKATVQEFERDGTGTVADMLAINRALSGGTAEDLLATPRFADVDEYHRSLVRNAPR